MSGFITEAVSMPTDLLAEFHEMYGRWLALHAPSASGGQDSRGWAPDDTEGARALVRLLSDRARVVLGLWAARPGEWVSGTDTAVAADLNGARGVAGALSSVGKAAAKLGRALPFEHRDGTTGESGSYRMTPVVAELFGPVLGEVA